MNSNVFVRIIDLIKKIFVIRASFSSIFTMTRVETLCYCEDSCGTRWRSAYLLIDDTTPRNVLAIRSHEECRRHRPFGIGVGVVVDRLLIVRCKIG